MSDELTEYMHRMLALMEAYQTDEVYWSCRADLAPITFFVPVLDLFEQDQTEMVTIGPEDMDAFEAALRSVAHATDGDATYGPQLYACRKRGQRPRNTRFPVDRRVHELFELTGPERLIEAAAHSLGHRGAGQILTFIPEHECRPGSIGGPDHCGLCGRRWNADEISGRPAAG